MKAEKSHQAPDPDKKKRDPSRIPPKISLLGSRRAARQAAALLSSPGLRST
jgi:hypothetical protein